MRKTLFWTNKKFVTYNKFSSQNNVRKYHPDGMKRFCNTLLNANHSQIQNKSVIIKSAESLEILQKIRQIALWDVAIMDKVRQKAKSYIPSTVALTIDCVCSKILNHGLFLSPFKIIPYPIKLIVCTCVSLFLALPKMVCSVQIRSFK